MINLIFGVIAIILAFVFAFVGQPYLAAGMTLVIGGTSLRFFQELKAAKKRYDASLVLTVKEERTRLNAIEKAFGKKKVEAVLADLLKDAYGPTK